MVNKLRIRLKISNVRTGICNCLKVLTTLQPLFSPLYCKVGRNGRVRILKKKNAQLSIEEVTTGLFSFNQAEEYAETHNLIDSVEKVTKTNEKKGMRLFSLLEVFISSVSYI